MYTINNPLKVEAVNQGYYSDTQLSSEVEEGDEFVSKEIAVELLEALKVARDSLKTYGKHPLIDGQIEKTISNAEK